MKIFKILIVSIPVLLNICFGQIIINEVLYDPAGTDTGAEWIELKNVGVGSVDITGYDINATSGDYLTFPSLSVPAGDFVIVHWNTDGINDTDFTDNIAHIYTGSSGFGNMGNTSGWVAFFNSTTHSSATIIDYIEYGAGDRTWENDAVTAGIWTEDNFAVDVVESHSLEYDGSGDLGSDWLDQATPTQGADNSLPVELSSFTVDISLEGVLIKWRTESEIENLGFFIERKTNGSNWIEIASYKTENKLLGQGTVSFETEYEYIDRFIEKGQKYEYRLADVDYNGVITYHATRSIVIDSKPLPAIVDNFTVLAYPNPFNPTLNIRYSVQGSGDKSIVEVDIFNLAGELVANLLDINKSAGWHEVKWNGLDDDGNNVSGGIYVYRVRVGNEVRSNKIIFLQ